MSRPISISIIIPVKNGVATIRQCLDAIFAQTLIDQAEVIVIDSGSTDGTLEVLKQYPVRLYQIPPEEFNHGATRNYGVSLAKGEFVVMTVQDAVAVNPQWLNIMLNHFSDKNVAGVCGRQMIPQKTEINPFEWTRPVNQPQIVKYHFPVLSDFTKLAPQEKRDICGWDNVNSMYRKSTLEAIPFSRVKFGEDITWVIKALKQGYSITYDPNAKVEHHHPFNSLESFNRKYIEMMQDYLLFDLLPKKRNYLNKLVRLAYLSYKWKIHPKWLITEFKKNLSYNKAVKKFYSDIKSTSKEQLSQELL